MRCRMQILIDIPKELYDYIKDEKYDAPLDKRFDFQIRYAVANAIKQEPCEDCISRKHIQDKYRTCADMLHEDAAIVMEWVNEAPSVTPTEKVGEWIPVMQRLPEENKTVIASTEYGVYPEAKYTQKYGWEWAYEAGVDYWEGIKEIVTAWMPLPTLPKKYEPESEE